MARHVRSRYAIVRSSSALFVTTMLGGTKGLRKHPPYAPDLWTQRTCTWTVSGVRIVTVANAMDCSFLRLHVAGRLLSRQATKRRTTSPLSVATWTPSARRCTGHPNLRYTESCCRRCDCKSRATAIRTPAESRGHCAGLTRARLSAASIAMHQRRMVVSVSALEFT